MYSVIIQILQAHFIEKEKHFSDPEFIACIIFCSVFQKSGMVLTFSLSFIILCFRREQTDHFKKLVEYCLKI